MFWKAFQGGCAREKSEWIGTEVCVVHHGLYIFTMPLYNIVYLYIKVIKFKPWKWV
jgi:hypothetical protein